MSELTNFRLPDLGEGLTESELVAWRVAVGDTVELNQIIAEVETAKALVELPSPFAGVIGALYAQPGQVVQVGEPLIGFDMAASGQPEAPVPAPVEAAAPVQREAVLVGYGPRVEGGRRPQRKARSASWLERADAARDLHLARPAPPLRKLAHATMCARERPRRPPQPGRPARPSRACAGSWPRPWSRARSRRRTPPNSSRST
jgi:2-oxoisovalerate dehydrogenase E2 component (dihydrolipoyl transacylase)